MVLNDIDSLNESLNFNPGRQSKLNDPMTIKNFSYLLSLGQVNDKEFYNIF